MSNQQEVRIANSSPVHTASGKDEPTGSQPSNQVEEHPNRKRTVANSPTTSSEDRYESIQQRILPQRRIHLPDCARCKKPPVEPHAVYCCGSMYCHTCLVSKMAAAASERSIVTCDKCQKPMGESPTQRKTLRAETVAADSRELSQPPAKILRIDPGPSCSKGIPQSPKIAYIIEQLGEIRSISSEQMANQLPKLMKKFEKLAIKEDLSDKELSDFIDSLKILLEEKVLKEEKVKERKQLVVDFIKKCGSQIDSIRQHIRQSARNTAIQERQLLAQLEKLLDEFCKNYLDVLNKNIANSNEKSNSACQNRINSYHSDVSEGIMKYRKLTKVANLNLYCDPTSMNSIFSTEFDTTGERFAVAGVTRKIKIFNFDSFFKNQTKRHVPLNQLDCQAAISSTSWNPVQNEILANSDYDGHVSLWDVETGQVVRSFHEHERSCWTVSFNNVDPKLMVSGSEDAKVKIWNINCDRSMANIRAELGVCSVCFHPNERNQLIFGSEDHKVYLYDIRNVERPLKVFQGHNKTVSYVKFLSNTTIVSASADSSLRVWDTVERRCLKVLKGHTNEKNFVGLSSNGDHILCGSENGRVFLYYKEHDEPITSYVLGKDGSTNDDDAEGFVSSVCWKKGTNYALAANSHGRVHLLEASRRVD